MTADHFGEDHKDVDCYVTYYSKAQRMTVNAEVTLHADPRLQSSGCCMRWIRTFGHIAAFRIQVIS